MSPSCGASTILGPVHLMLYLFPSFWLQKSPHKIHHVSHLKHTILRKATLTFSVRRYSSKFSLASIFQYPVKSTGISGERLGPDGDRRGRSRCGQAVRSGWWAARKCASSGGRGLLGRRQLDCKRAQSRREDPS